MSKCSLRGPCIFCYLAGLPWLLIMKLRSWLYRRGWKKSFLAKVPVICVGNITTGGTGKTPMVEWVVKYLKTLDKNPAILTRGYKACDGISDEASYLSNATSVEVVINPDRVEGATTAVNSGCDVLVMDDGFQHRRLRRDLDIVLVDATRPFGGGYGLPVGRLRQSPSSLKDTDCVIITRSDLVEPEYLDQLKDKIANIALSALIITAVHKSRGLSGPDGKIILPESIARKEAFVFCGIGNPDGFIMTLDSLGIDICGKKIYQDHVEYDPEIYRELSELGKDSGADLLITTTKDGIKLNPEKLDLPLYQLQIEIEITENEEQLKNLIRSTVNQ